MDCRRLGLLHDLVPNAATIAALANRGRLKQQSEDTDLGDARDAAAVLGQKLLVLEASTGEEIDAQFARLDQEPADAMLVTASPFFLTRAGQITALAARRRIPAVYIRRDCCSSTYTHTAKLSMMARTNIRSSSIMLWPPGVGGHVCTLRKAWLDQVGINSAATHAPPSIPTAKTNTAVMALTSRRRLCLLDMASSLIVIPSADCLIP